MKLGSLKAENRQEIRVVNNMVGLVIGRGGETIKQINNRTGAYVVLSKAPEHQNIPGYKILMASGTPEQIENAKREIDNLLEMAQKGPS